MAFSSGEKSTKKGAGPAGLGFTTTEFGYLVLGGGVNWGNNSGIVMITIMTLPNIS